MSNTRTDAHPLGASLAATMGICGLLLAVTLCYPYVQDNVPQEYIAARLLHGELPYVGTWDQNFPGTVFIHAAQQLIFGRSAVAFHVMDMLLQLLAVAFIYKLARKLLNPAAGLFAALFYTLYYVLNGMDDLVGQKDVYATIAMLVGLYCVIGSQRWRFPLSGMLFGFAILIRPTYGLHTVAVGAYILTSEWYAVSYKRALLRCLAFFAGSSLPLGLFALGYSIGGHFTDFYEATFLFTTQIYNPRFNSGIFFAPSSYLGIAQLFALIGCIAIWRGRTHRRELALLASMLIMSALSLALLWGYRYHAQPLYACVLIMAGIGVGGLLTWIAAHLPASLAPARCYLPLIIVLCFILLETRGTTQKSLGVDLFSGRIHTRDELLSRFAIEGTFDPAKEEALGRYIVYHAKPGDRMESFHAAVYPQFIADLQPANRFILTIPIVMRGPTGDLTAFQKKWKQEYIDSIVSVRPRWFLLPDPPTREGLTEHGLLPRELLREDFPQIQAMLDSFYRVDTVVWQWTLYGRK